MPAYAAAVAQAGIPLSGTVADVGCGTGRALPALRRAVGPHGTVIAIDVTPEMGLTRAAGWELTTYDDAADRFFALAVRD